MTSICVIHVLICITADIKIKYKVKYTECENTVCFLPGYLLFNIKIIIEIDWQQLLSSSVQQG